MRLSTLNKQLSDMFMSSTDAKALFEKVFWRSYGTFDAEMKRELEADEKLLALAKHQIPCSEDLTALSESYDERYFDLEEEGDLDASGRYFQKARITASMAQASKAHSNLDYAEAAYEALMACDDPHSLDFDLSS
jgi:hypothetical protein